MKKLNLYTIDSIYYQYISKFENKLPQIYGSKSNRPFVGVIIEVDGSEFFAPLTSPKSKHQKMKNREDFHKIEGGKLGAINFNNMVPVPKECLNKVNLKISLMDSKKDKKYKRLMQNQKEWCNDNKKTLQVKGEKLYFKYVFKSLDEEVRKRCCDFVVMKIKCEEWVN